jgi:hypothetical protein
MIHSVGLFCLLFLYLGKAANVTTECNTQLHDYYVALGMPMLTPVQPAVSFTTGFFMGTPFVQVTLAFQAAARVYANLLPGPPPLANQSFVAYVSIDLPWCVTDITFQCCDNVTVGTAKTSNCTTITDFDLGGSSPVAGRFFIYANQTAACLGTMVVKFFNTIIIPGEQGIYTYDVVGLQQHREMNFSEALLTYRTSRYLFSDGDPADVVNQSQFVCVEQRIGCNATRTNGKPSLQAVPVPQFACIGRTRNDSVTESVLWTVSSFQPVGGLNGLYGITFVTNLALAPAVEFNYQQFGTVYVLIPDTVKQFDSGIDSLDQYALLFYQGYWTSFQPKFPYSKDPFVNAVPCACGFTMFCDANFNVDLTSLYNGFVELNNAVPVCDPGPDQFVGFGTATFTINANRSYDIDNAPAPFTTYWRVYSTPYDPSPPPFTITDPGNPIQTFNSASLQQGSYIFLLYASDLQDQVPCFLNVTILPNQVFAIVDHDFIIPFTFYSGLDANHSCLIFPPSPSIPLNGSYSFDTNPAMPIYCSWIQTAGFPLTFSCDLSGFTATAAFFNTTDCIAQFVPPLPGLYCFQLTVTDNSTNSSASICVQVNPNFQQPQSTFTPILNFTPPPLRNLTFPPRAPLDFPNFSQPPFNSPAPHAPSNGTGVNTSNPGLVILVHPLTVGDYIILGTLGAAALCFFAFLTLMFILYRDEGLYRVFDKKTYGQGRPIGQ